MTRTARLLLLLLVLPCLALAQGVPSAKNGPLLERALADPDGVMLRDDGTYAVWVYFADRGLDAAGLRQALAQAEAALPRRTLDRRAKALAPGQRAVDARDLPPAVRYVDAVTATGASARQQSRWFNAVSVNADRSQLAAIAALPFVERLELVATFRRPAPPVREDQRLEAAELRDAAAKNAGRWSIDYGASQAGLEQINVPPVHEMGITGAGVIIGMLDSGFKTTHNALAGIPVIARYDFINNDEIVENEAGDPSSQHNHGTMTMSTAMGFADGELVGPAFGATAILAKTEDVSQEVPLEEDNWVAGLEWVESLGADVVSSSLGYLDWYEFADMDGNTAVTTVAADLAVGRGVVVVNSAGNERGFGFNHIIAPADGDSVIAAGAVTLSGSIASFSSPGPTYDGRIKPDVSAQGVGNHVVSPYDDTSYTSADGTSFSCPLTSGVAALVLARAPSLTPMQVREALRETADRAANPDNDFGWGILDAYAAVTYWGATIDHAPLGDTEDTTGPYTVDAVITDRLALDPAAMIVRWRTSGFWQQTPLTLVSGDQWTASIPGQPAGAAVEYYLEVTDTAGITTSLPAAGAAAPYAFAVGPDATLPVMAHTPLGDQPLQVWPPLVRATVTDNLGVDRVELSYTMNGGVAQGPFLLVADGDVYSLPFPVAAGGVAIGDQFTYTLTAWDQAGAPNSVQSGPHAFEVIDTLGIVLVIDDGAAKAADVKYGPDKTRLPAEAGKSAATDIAAWLTEAGYVADVVAASAVGPGSFAGYQAVVLSSGSNNGPVASATLRAEVEQWALGGGRILVEGGEIGYDALSSPGYPSFAQNVLHAAAWDSDSAGALQVAGGQGGHPLMTTPHALPPSIAITYSGYGDEDAVEPAADALVVMQPSSFPGDAGILVYDDNPAPQAGQIVYLAFNIGAVDPVEGRQIIENGLAYLLAAESGADASIAGTVTVMGGGDPSGTVITAGNRQTTAAADGTYLLADMYAGAYTVTASKDGYALAVQEVTLAGGQQLTGVDFALAPVTEVNVSSSPNLPIPDADPAGVSDVINVPQTGVLSGVTVDIQLTHTWIGDLTVTLTSPAGTAVTLHNRSGSSADDIVGNWPQTLVVDGPGTLDDFLAEGMAGDWTLHVADGVGSDTGTLVSWGLNLLTADTPTASDDVPTVTRLAGNRPNPFNPRTTVSFDLAAAGRVTLDVFDLRGRLVRTLVDERLPAGRHDVLWDGRDAGGRETASGVYLCRLRAGGADQMRKMTLVR